MPNIELMKEAYAIIGGIPERAFDLETVVRCKGESLECGTIACAAGWLAMHPKFKELGLDVELGSTTVMKLGGIPRWYDRAMEIVFDISNEDAFSLFGYRRPDEKRGIHAEKSDRDIWLRRVRLWLADQEVVAQCR